MWFPWVGRCETRVYGRGSTTGSLNHEHAVNEALCFGWIDSMANTNSAKRHEARAKRVDETAALAARNERANRWRPKR